jgi:LmbE family N-acetylglucosaminyl deacetylase
MANRRLLIAYAHPDDESFGNGGTIAKYVNEGVDVYLVCATDGDMGTIPEEMRGQYNSVRELRLSELDCASEKLGFKRVFKFGYKDSGMMGSESSNDPECLWYQWNNNSEDVTRRVVEVMREIKPHVVITFNEYGGYGHPDHIAIQRATVEAFELAADPDYITDGQPPYQAQKLYYSSIPAMLVKIALWWIKLRGKDPRRMGTNNDIDFEAIVDHIQPTHTTVNIREYLEAWDEASACHQSQGGGGSFFPLPMWLRKLLTPTQGFTRVHPAPAQDTIDEHDLFAGVTVDEARPEMA